MTKSKKRQCKHKKHYRISRKKLIKKGRKGQTGGIVSRFLRNVRLVNMVDQRSVAFVLAHGCILGAVAAGMQVPRRFVLPNNVNIITLTALNKTISKRSLKGYESEDRLTHYISQNHDMFEHDNMGSTPTEHFRSYCESYLREHFQYMDPDRKNPALFDIRNPDGVLYVRNHIYPSEINDALVTDYHEVNGAISIYNKGKLVKKITEYNTSDGKTLPLGKMPVSVMLCYLFGKEDMQEIITLPHLTMVLHTCREYCLETDVTSIIDDTVYSAAADAHALSHVMHGLTLSRGDEVLITGTSNLDLNTRIGVVEERTANGRYGIRIGSEPPKSFAMANLRKIVRMSAPPPPDTVVLYRLNTDRNKTSTGKIRTSHILPLNTVLIRDCYSGGFVPIPNDDVYLIF
jgi:hypothetical protein